MKRTKSLPAILLTALLMVAALLPGMTAVSAEAKEIRVGFFSFPGYHIEDSAGRRSGYGYEVLQLIARHTDWSYKYLYHDSFYSDCLEKLERGELDIVTSVSKTADREEKFLFSEKDIGTNSTIFTVKAGNTAVSKGNYATYDGLRIAMLEGNSKNEIFAEFAAEKFTYTPVMFETDEELTRALENGQVDGIVSGSLRAMQDEWLIESLSPQPFYICVNKDRRDLMDEIDAALSEMDLHESDWRDVLHNKYYATDESGNIVVSSEERDYLDALNADGTKLKVLINPDRAPYSYFEGGTAKGIFPALFAKMTETVDLPYEYVSVKSRKEYSELRRSGAADIVLDFSDDLCLAEESGYKISDPYYTTTHTMLKRRDLKGNPKTIAVLKYAEGSYSGYLDRYVGEGVTPVTEFETLDATIEAVKRGECDATITLSYVAERYTWTDERGELLSELIGEASSVYTFGVNSSRAGHHLLLSLLNKCLGLDRGTINAIVTAEVTAFRPSQTGGLLTFLRRNPIYIAFIITAVFLFLFVIVLLVVRTLNQRKLREKVDEVTEKFRAQTEELSAALHAADAANRSKTTFLNNMSHDIRTPMNAIIGFTALATAHLDNRERALDYLEKISQASNHLLSLINDVLDMSRIESGKVHIESRPENLADILQGLRNIIQTDIHAKRLELFIDTVDVVNEEVYCDKLRLNQIMLNLTSNAIKFTGSGGTVSIKITQKPSEKEGYGIYEFSVSDTGIGMSPEFLETVFEPFTRERNSTVSGIQGTGLGMAITKNIVDIMGGKIEVQSEQGKGTEFTVTLELQFAEGSAEQFSLAELQGFNALVVDDDLVSCRSVAKMLRLIGMHAEWTVTGREAVVRTAEAIEMEQPFEVFIIDWSMPDMDGISTVRQIRAIIGDDSPIILMSAYDWADIEQDARDAGVTGFISKPLFASDLHRALEKSLGKASPKEAPAPKERSFRGKRILLVEDNELNREIAKELLTEADFLVECAENGKMACEMVEEAGHGYYDLILMDVQMPIMNGYEATRRIRALEDRELASVPIIAMTANAFEEDKAAAFEAGMNEHLAKPIDAAAMLDLLEKVLGGPSKEG